MTCKDCVHERVCFALIKEGLPYADGEYPAEAFCMAFKNKADVVEVVRCKDCILHEEGCPLDTHPYMTADNGYCYLAKRTPKERGD